VAVMRFWRSVAVKS